VLFLTHIFRLGNGIMASGSASSPGSAPEGYAPEGIGPSGRLPARREGIAYASERMMEYGVEMRSGNEGRKIFH
jgi:hypothetical protein